ncbi:MAG: hypothetical protein PHX83_16190 [Acidobacteriia bacterium]|nr:hypothetical protein [Terriglobia bacterium]
MAMKSLEDILKFDSLPAAENTLREIHSLFLQSRSTDDPEGLNHCRDLIRKGKRRALMISRNKRVNASKREEKKEIAQWFTVWLQTPELFWEWLDLRKSSPDFISRFGGATSPQSS